MTKERFAQQKRLKRRGEVVMVHVGRKPPKGWREIGSSMHIGYGMWVMRIVRDQ